AEEAKIRKIDVEGSLRVTAEEAQAKQGVGGTLTLDRLGGALHGDARMCQRITLAGFTGKQRAAGVGQQSLRMSRQGGYEDDWHAVEIGRRERPADGGKAGGRIDDGKRHLARATQENPRQPPRIVVGFAQDTGLVGRFLGRLAGHDASSLRRCRVSPAITSSADMVPMTAPLSMTPIAPGWRASVSRMSISGVVLLAVAATPAAAGEAEAPRRITSPAVSMAIGFMCWTKSDTYWLAGLRTISDGVPHWMIRPPSMMAMRLPMRNASSRSWLTNRMVFFSLLWNPSSSS